MILRILLGIVILAPVLCADLEAKPKEVPVSVSEKLIDFQNDDDLEWRVVNDGVMGGVSRSSLQRSDHGTGLFTGDLSLENNGGFASVRAQLGRCDLSGYEGLELRVRGDGRTYQLRLRTDDRLDGIAYRASFESSANEWITIQVLFADFQPTFRGRVPLDAPPLETGSISQIGFLLADSRPGAFSLEIDFVRTFGSAVDKP
jgi:monofunctional biosynthetic peptidoglycan transglycosylase